MAFLAVASASLAASVSSAVSALLFADRSDRCFGLLNACIIMHPFIYLDDALVEMWHQKQLGQKQRASSSACLEGADLRA